MTKETKQTIVTWNNPKCCCAGLHIEVTRKSQFSAAMGILKVMDPPRLDKDDGPATLSGLNPEY